MREAAAAGAWALVDLLGWPDEPSGPVGVDVQEHREGLLGALHSNADRLLQLIGDEADDAQRATRKDDLQALREFESAVLSAVECAQQTTVTATMPGDVVELLRGALYSHLERACEDIPVSGAKDSCQLGGRSATPRAGT
jgi:hypothetical protein